MLIEPCVLPDKTQPPLPGFEQDDYTIPSKANRHTKENLIADYRAVRLATISLLKSMDEDMLQSIGQISGDKLSAIAAFYIIVGHGNTPLQIY